MRTRTARRTRIALGGLLGLTLLVAPACSRTARQTIEGVDCIVVKSPVGVIRALDCNWPTEE